MKTIGFIPPKKAEPKEVKEVTTPPKAPKVEPKKTVKK